MTYLVVEHPHRRRRWLVVKMRPDGRGIVVALFADEYRAHRVAYSLNGLTAP